MLGRFLRSLCIGVRFHHLGRVRLDLLDRAALAAGAHVAGDDAVAAADASQAAMRPEGFEADPFLEGETGTGAEQRHAKLVVEVVFDDQRFVVERLEIVDLTDLQAAWRGKSRRCGKDRQPGDGKENMLFHGSKSGKEEDAPHGHNSTMRGPPLALRHGLAGARAMP